VVETELGVLDADLKTQLEILEKALGGGIPKGAAGDDEEVPGEGTHS
jgi:flagellar biosynthesis/type III secretory pathway protein FliH